MTSKEKCCLCGIECNRDVQTLDRPGATRQILLTFDCPTCGTYDITGDAQDFLEKRTRYLYAISGVTRHHWDNIRQPLTITWQMVKIDSNFESDFLSQEPKSVQGKIALLLQYIARQSRKPGDKVQLTYPRDYPIAFCRDGDELRFYLRHLNQAQVIDFDETFDQDGAVSLTVEGWAEVERLTTPNIESKQVFVAMWFDDSMNEVFAEGIKPLEQETGFSMFRVDKTQFINEKICDKIVMEIKRSRFLIVDVTGHREAVYFEAGYAMGTGLPVIWTCKESDINNCCFDTRQYNHIVWKNSGDLRTQLGERILATIGQASNWNK